MVGKQEIRKQPKDVGRAVTYSFNLSNKYMNTPGPREDEQVPK